MSASLALVTGAPGWLGTRFVDALVHGLPGVPPLAAPAARRVRCLVLRGTPRAALPEGVEVVEGDVRDPSSLREFVRDAEGATLFHLCGVIRPRRVRDFQEVNVDGTRNVLDAAAGARVARLIAVSSNAAIGSCRRPDDCFDENARPHPHLHYGRSKHGMDELVRGAFATGRMATTIIRPCRFYGPGQPPTRTRFYQLIREGRLPLLGGGRARWSLSYVDDICQGLLLAERTPRANGQSYWIADRRPYPLHEIVDTVERVFERDFGMAVSHRRLRLPLAVGLAAAAAEEALERMGVRFEHVHAIAHLQATVACSVAKAERELGWAPTVELEEGLRRAIRWSIEHGEIV